MKISANEYFPFLVDNLEDLIKTKEPLWHPLGFTSCLIEEVKNVREIRVNYWPLHQRRTKNPDWPIHTHRYHLSSMVLAGSVEDIQYVTEDGSSDHIYEVRYSGKDSEIKKTSNRISLKENICNSRKAGEVYEVERGVFHQSYVGMGESAITLVALSNFSDVNPLVVGQEGSEFYPYERKSFSADHFWSKVRLAVNAISSAENT